MHTAWLTSRTWWHALDLWWADDSGRQVQEVWGSWVILADYKR